MRESMNMNKIGVHKINKNLLKFTFTVHFCTRCKWLEDKGLRTVIRYDKNKRFVKERFDVRWYCNKYREFLKTFYESCTDFELKENG